MASTIIDSPRVNFPLITSSMIEGAMLARRMMKKAIGRQQMDVIILFMVTFFPLPVVAVEYFDYFILPGRQAELPFPVGSGRRQKKHSHGQSTDCAHYRAHGAAAVAGAVVAGETACCATVAVCVATPASLGL